MNLSDETGDIIVKITYQLVSDKDTSCDLHISIIGFKVNFDIFDHYSYETIPAEIITAEKIMH